MANIIWTPPDGWVEESGAHVSFKAPCDCSAAGNLVIGSNSYSIVDAIGGKLTGSSGVFVSGAVLDFILDCENLKAYLQNPATSEITTSVLNIKSTSSSDDHRYLNWRNSDGALRWALTNLSGENGGLAIHQYDASGNWKSYSTLDSSSNLALGGKITASNIASGSVTITPPSGGGTTYVWVSFSKTFPSTPCVVATARTSVPGNCACGVTSIDTSGFRLYLYRNGATATTVNWIAISS